MRKKSLLKEAPIGRLVIFGLIIILAFPIFSMVYARGPFSSRSLRIEIFADGVVSVDYSLDVDTTYTSVNVPLFGVPFGDIIVLNHLGEPLDYELTVGSLKIDSLGTYRVRIIYETKDLTDEIGGGVWTFHINSPINVTIVLPRDADIIPNKPPITIENIKDKTILVMPPGDLEILYAIIVSAPIPVPVEVPGAPANALAYDHSSIIPTKFFKRIPAGRPTVLIFKNFLLMVNSSEKVYLNLNVGSSVAMKYFKLILKHSESLSLDINVDVSPPPGIIPPAGNINIYVNITTTSVEATLGIYINETALETELGRDIDVSRLTWMYWDETRWVPVPSRIDADGYLIVNTTHLSMWSIAKIIPLQVTAQLTPEIVTQGDAVVISATVKDDLGNLIEGATVTATVGDETINLSDIGNGKYQGTIETSNLKEGTCEIVITAQKVGFELAQTSQILTVKAAVPWMLYGGIIAVIIIVIIAVVLYRFKGRS